MIPPRLLRQTLLLVVVHLELTPVVSLGGEKAFYQTPQMTPGVSFRHNVCDRYDLFRNKTVELKDALEGMKLSVAMANYPEAYFNYDAVTGVDKNYPGLSGVILDELAYRAGFTWRDSFGITTDPADSNSTWKELLLWSIETYDINGDWWAQNLERMNLGVAFLKQWYDSGIILIAKEVPAEISDEINFWNWTRPYEKNVWILTAFTILLSGVVYQTLEWYADDRQDRSMWEWWQQNAYLSAINFTQAYEYQPKTLATRVFGISMAIWALVMTATYTANLASLLVDREPPVILAQTLDEVAVYGNKLCTWEGTYGDDYVRINHPKANRVPKKTILEVYQGLRSGECEYAAEAVASWNKLKSLREYNPYCDLYWVGEDRKVVDGYAGFVSKVDSGRLCTGFIRDVLNLHLKTMMQDGFLSGAWEKEYKRTQSIDCDTYRPEIAALIAGQSMSMSTGTNSTDDENGSRRYLLGLNGPQWSQRKLKAGGKGAVAGAAVAAAGSAASATSTKLTMEQMIGTFAFHWALMLLALILANINALYVRYGKQQAKRVTAKLRDSVTAKLRDSIGKNVLTTGTSTVHTRQCSEASESGEEVDNATTFLQPLEEMRFQLDHIRQSQSHVQSQAEQFQKEMQQTVEEMLRQQRRLEAQMGALLEAHRSQRHALAENRA